MKHAWSTDQDVTALILIPSHRAWKCSHPKISSRTHTNYCSYNVFLCLFITCSSTQITINSLLLAQYPK
jgi:hypothetical protein